MLELQVTLLICFTNTVELKSKETSKLFSISSVIVEAACFVLTRSVHSIWAHLISATLGANQVKSAVRHLVSHFKRIISIPRRLLLLTARSLHWALIQQNSYVHINNFTFSF